MNHPDERTIALYVLNARDVEAERAVIARHLEECAGCAAIHKELAEYMPISARWNESRLNEAPSRCIHRTER